MPQSKLKSVTPLNTSYTTDRGTFWNQTVEFEDGTIGGASSKDPVAKWKVGEEYTYEVSKNGNYTNIRGIKPVNSFSKGGGGYDTLGMQIGNAMSNACLLAAHKAIKVEDIERIAHRLMVLGNNIRQASTENTLLDAKWFQQRA